MPKYIVQHTPILHGKTGEKKASSYDIGAVVELTDEEAMRLGDNVQAAEETKVKKDKEK
jgi:hypothetical protein